MKTSLQIIGIVIACLITCSLSECDKDEVVNVVEITTVSPPSRSTIEPDTEITFKFDGIPEGLTVNKGTIRIGSSIEEIVVVGPFTPGELNLTLDWKDGRQSFTYTVKGALFESVNPADGSTLKAYDKIIAKFNGTPEKVTVNIGTATVSGEQVTIEPESGFRPGPLNLKITWKDGTQTLDYFISHEPVGKIEDIWVDHNVFEDGKKGMWIHVKLRVANMKGRSGNAVAYFYHENGAPLKGSPGFRTTSGNLSASTGITPRFEHSIYEDLRIFMPYGEIRLPQGKWNLKFSVQIHGPDDPLTDIHEGIGFELTEE